MESYIHKHCLDLCTKRTRQFKCLACGEEPTNYTNGIAICRNCYIENNTHPMWGGIKNNTIEDNEKNIEQKAHDNYNTWKEWWDKADVASKQAGITLEQGISFLDNLYKNHNIINEIE